MILITAKYTPDGSKEKQVTVFSGMVTEKQSLKILKSIKREYKTNLSIVTKNLQT